MGVVCTASEARWSRWVATAPTGRLWGVLAEPAPMAPALAAGPLAEQWDGTSWTVEPTAHPANSLDSTLWGASCTAASACMAVGTYNTGSGSTATHPSLAEQWDGTSWTVHPTPNPADSVATSLSGVSCTSPTACPAVGYYSHSNNSSLAERWDGTSWTVQPTPITPLPNSQADALNGVSCTSATACTAVGTADVTPTGGGNTLGVPLAEVWDGTSWTVQPIPNPAGSTTSTLQGVSCTSATACTAVGYHYAAGSNASSLAERWDGTSWTIQPTPTQAGSLGDSLSGVSCTSATACIAVGSYQDSATNNAVSLAERWDGTSWTIQATPNLPAGSLADSLSGVSCASAIACTAVGSSVSSGSIFAPVAEVWDGTSWTVQPTPNQQGSTSDALNAVSCTSVSACAVVGRHN